jgi:GTP cyclohydrolase II
MAELPSHASPYIAPQALHPNRPIDRFSLHPDVSSTSPGSGTSPAPHDVNHLPANHELEQKQDSTPALPESIISPAFTPPATPGGTLNLTLKDQIRNGGLIDHRQKVGSSKGPKLLERLPNVECIVRARIPTTTGAEMFLHLYLNDADNKEHLAIVFGNNIRSRSLDRVREGETEMDRMIRGAYVGRLHPGRISSRYDDNTDDGRKSQSSGDAGDQEVSEALREPGVCQSTQSQAPLVRIHSECYTGETAWSARCDCGEQLDEAARLMSTPPASLSEGDDIDCAAAGGAVSSPSSAESPGGVIIYLRQEGRGIGLGEKLKAYNLQDLGSDTVEANLLLRHPADARSYGLATAMLVDLGLGADSYPEGIRLLTNNPDKIRAVEGPNREVIVKERVPMIPLAWRTGGKRGIRSAEIEGYLRTKVSTCLL